MESNQSTNLLEEPKTLPGMLNVLTILTFIGCGIAYLSTLYNLFTASHYQEQLAKLEEMQDKMGDSELASKMMKGSIDIMHKTYEYRYVLLLSGIIFTTFCLIGALQMRKLKKSGFPLYLIGELAPLVVSGALIGFSMIGGIATIVAAVFALVFVILYSTQRKYLTRN